MTQSGLLPSNSFCSTDSCDQMQTVEMHEICLRSNRVWDIAWVHHASNMRVVSPLALRQCMCQSGETVRVKACTNWFDLTLTRPFTVMLPTSTVTSETFVPCKEAMQNNAMLKSTVSYLSLDFFYWWMCKDGNPHMTWERKRKKETKPNSVWFTPVIWHFIYYVFFLWVIIVKVLCDILPLLKH